MVESLIMFSVGVLVGSIPTYINKRIKRKARLSGTIFVDLYDINGPGLFLELNSGVYEVSKMKEITCSIKNVTTRR